MTNPYLSEDGRPELRPSWLAFLDVQGFTELMLRMHVSRTHQKSVLDQARDTEQLWDRKPGGSYNTVLFPRPPTGLEI